MELLLAPAVVAAGGAGERVRRVEALLLRAAGTAQALQEAAR
jgi:hypothetical protein